MPLAGITAPLRTQAHADAISHPKAHIHADTISHSDSHADVIPHSGAAADTAPAPISHTRDLTRERDARNDIP